MREMMKERSEMRERERGEEVKRSSSVQTMS